jgi:hypothetical protein
LITVHHLNNSRSQRVLWLLEELGCGYQVQKYQRDPRTLLAPLPGIPGKARIATAKSAARRPAISHTPDPLRFQSRAVHGPH